MRYTPWGELRYSWTDPDLNTTPAYELPDYTYTGQRSYTADFGLMFYNARWYDPALGRFAQADTIVPNAFISDSWDRFSYCLNNPIRYSDPTGNFTEDQVKAYLKNTYGAKSEKYLKAWKLDGIFWAMLTKADYDDRLFAPTTKLGMGQFTQCGDTFCFENKETGATLLDYQGYGPYLLQDINGLPKDTGADPYPGTKTYSAGFSTSPHTWVQPIFNYQGDEATLTGYRVVSYDPGNPSPTLDAGTGIPYAPIGGVFGGITIYGIFSPIPEPVSVGSKIMAVASLLSYLNNSVLRIERLLNVSVNQPPSHELPFGVITNGDNPLFP
jgi:RHS repeat-associated protein